MIKKEECFRVRGNIVALKTLSSEEVIYALEHKSIKSFAPKECKNLKSLWIEYLSSQTTAIAFHPTQDLVALANDRTIYIIDTQTKLVQQTIISYSGEITILHFVQNSPYLITGTKNGRVVQYRYEGKSSLSRLCSFPFNNPIGKKVIGKNYVGAIDSNDQYVACSGYGGAITIIKLHSLTHKQTIQSARVRVNVLKLISNELLISASVDGNIYFHDLKRYKATKTISSPIGNITNIVLVNGTKYAILHGESSKVALLDIEQQKIITNDFLHFELEIKFLEVIDPQTLIVVLETNTIEKVFLPTVKQLDTLLVKNELEKAFLLIEQNPMLQDSSLYAQLENLYKQLYIKALNAFLASNKQEAVKLLEPFKKIKAKKGEISLLLESFEQYKKFHTLFLEKKYAIAYAMSEKYPIFEQTHPYKKMEQEFQKVFTFAQKQINIGRSDIAHDILGAYATVNSKKDLIKLLLKHNKEFLLFLRSIKAKNYKNVALLIKQEPSLSKLPQYQNFLQELEKKLLSIQYNIHQTKTEEAIEAIKELQYLPEIKERLKDLYELANYTKLFLNCYDKNDFLSCYETIDKSKELEDLQLSQRLEKHWHKLIDKCEVLALKGDLKGIKEVLSELITLKSRSAKVGDIIRLSFHTKIKQLLAKRTYAQAESIIYSYIDIFGIDTEIKALMKSYEKLANKKLAITTNQELFKPRDAWLDSEFIVGEHKPKP